MGQRKEKERKEERKKKGEMERRKRKMEKGIEGRMDRERDGCSEDEWRKESVEISRREE